MSVQLSSFCVGRRNREVSKLLSCIALVEMHHLEILAETIYQLGVDPGTGSLKRTMLKSIGIAVLFSMGQIFVTG